jgi:hypothetical protein
MCGRWGRKALRHSRRNDAPLGSRQIRAVDSGLRERTDPASASPDWPLASGSLGLCFPQVANALAATCCGSARLGAKPNLLE